nr:MAG: hypothetical protein [Porcellio scaber clopovirus]
MAYGGDCGGGSRGGARSGNNDGEYVSNFNSSMMSFFDNEDDDDNSSIFTNETNATNEIKNSNKMELNDEVNDNRPLEKRKWKNDIDGSCGSSGKNSIKNIISSTRRRTNVGKIRSDEEQTSQKNSQFNNADNTKKSIDKMIEDYNREEQFAFLNTTPSFSREKKLKNKSEQRQEQKDDNDDDKVDDNISIIILDFKNPAEKNLEYMIVEYLKMYVEEFSYDFEITSLKDSLEKIAEEKNFKKKFSFFWGKDGILSKREKHFFLYLTRKVFEHTMEMTHVMKSYLAEITSACDLLSNDFVFRLRFIVFTTLNRIDEMYKNLINSELGGGGGGGGDGGGGDETTLYTNTLRSLTSVMTYLFKLKIIKSLSISLFSSIEYLNLGDKKKSLTFLFPTLTYFHNEFIMERSGVVSNNEEIYREIVENCDAIESLFHPSSLFSENYIIDPSLDLRLFKIYGKGEKNLKQHRFLSLIMSNEHDKEKIESTIAKEKELYLNAIDKNLTGCKEQNEEYLELLLALNLIKIYTNFLIESTLRNIEERADIINCGGLNILVERSRAEHLWLQNFISEMQKYIFDGSNTCCEFNRPISPNEKYNNIYPIKNSTGNYSNKRVNDWETDTFNTNNITTSNNNININNNNDNINNNNYNNYNVDDNEGEGYDDYDDYADESNNNSNKTSPYEYHPDINKYYSNRKNKRAHYREKEIKDFVIRYRKRNRYGNYGGRGEDTNSDPNEYYRNTRRH